MSFSTPLADCPKCGKGQDRSTAIIGPNEEPKEGDFAVCWDCGAICKFTFLGFLEEMTEYEVENLPEEPRNAILKLQTDIRNGVLKNPSPKAILAAAEYTGGLLAKQVSEIRDSVVAKGIVPAGIVNNIMVQAVAYQLAVAIMCALYKGDKENQGSEFIEVRNMLNRTIIEVCKRFGRDYKTFEIDIPSKEDEGDFWTTPRSSS